MSKQPSDRDLLLPFEIQFIRGEYKEFYKIKRNNLFATIQEFSSLWSSYQLLDKIWKREIDDLHQLHESRKVFPALFFINAHIKYRIAMELAFSCSIVEAWGVLRVGIESVAHGHKIYREPQLAEVWLSKDDGKAQKRAFERAFEKNKKASLFPHGLAGLYDYWRHYSDWGSHTTIAAMAIRFRQTETVKELNWKLEYLVSNKTQIVTSLYSLLDASRHMENVFFDVFHTRFNLDIELVPMRSQFERRHEALAKAILKKYDIPSPFGSKS